MTPHCLTERLFLRNHNTHILFLFYHCPNNMPRCCNCAINVNLLQKQVRQTFILIVFSYIFECVGCYCHVMCQQLSSIYVYMCVFRDALIWPMTSSLCYLSIFKQVLSNVPLKL